MIYRIEGFFCEVLICANYARRCGVADFIIAAGLKNYAKRCGLADFIIADITAGLKTVCSQKLRFADKTRYTVCIYIYIYIYTVT